MKKILSIFITFIIIILTVILLSLNTYKGKEVKSSSKVKVVATLFPQYDFARQIGKDKVEVSLLLKPGTEVHTYDPSPKDIIKINESDIFIYTGKYMEPWSENIASSINRNVNITDASKNIDYIKEEHDQEEEEHDHEYDPHIWLNISNAKIMVDNILKAFIEVDPENASFYTENADKYKENLDELDKDFVDVISNAKRNIICFGDKFAYIYFINRYNLDYVTAYDGCSAGSEPSVSTILNIEKAIEKDNIPVIFYESLSNGTVAKSIANDMNIQALVFSSIHTLTNEELESGETYISLMRKNLDNLKIALY